MYRSLQKRVKLEALDPSKEPQRHQFQKDQIIPEFFFFPFYILEASSVCFSEGNVQVCNKVASFQISLKINLKDTVAQTFQIIRRTTEEPFFFSFIFYSKGFSFVCRRTFYSSKQDPRRNLEAHKPSKTACSLLYSKGCFSLSLRRKVVPLKGFPVLW